MWLNSMFEIIVSLKINMIKVEIETIFLLEKFTTENKSQLD